MRVVLQRVIKASVEVDNNIVGAISNGMFILLGVGVDDNLKELEWMVKKLIGLRIFEDASGKMNKSITDTNGSFLIVSQFTLYANCEKGNRPGFTEAAKSEKAIFMYNEFITQLEKTGIPVESGKFGADMKVNLINDGPVTIVIDSPINLRTK